MGRPPTRTPSPSPRQQARQLQGEASFPWLHLLLDLAWVTGSLLSDLRIIFDRPAKATRYRTKDESCWGPRPGGASLRSNSGGSLVPLLGSENKRGAAGGELPARPGRCGSTSRNG